MSSKYSDEKFDMHPKSWLSEYRNLSYWYLLKMGLFYSGLGLVAAFLIMGIEYFVFDYEEPIVPISLIQIILAGPVEETLFFGIPFAVSGNSFVVLGTGLLWASVHIFNAQFVEEDSFSYSTVGFAIPHIFFSLRAWKSGKGWFTILFHSAWNVMIFGISVAVGEFPFTVIDESFPELDIVMIVFSAILLGITYPLYRWRLKREIKKKLEKS
ncbi:MAG: CPBP family intramembrane metalloprotease [Nitrosopumilus sp.]|nr:CPBP family intramembrane metalloprotease [Nitrosopumilus sp.]